MNEADTCTKLVTPRLVEAGWDREPHSFTREKTFTDGRILISGNQAKRGTQKRADYLLRYQRDFPIAIIEAKDNNHTVSHGMQQALGYAEILQVPSAFSSNGDGFASHNKAPEAGEDIEIEFGLEHFPSPQVS